MNHYPIPHPIYHSIQNIIHFNNQGVVHYENSNFEKAKEYLQSAASQISSLIEHYQLNVYNGLVPPPLQTTVGSPIKGWSKPLHSTLQDHYSVAFTRAIIMAEYACPADETTYAKSYNFLVNVATMILLYNTSLLNHITSDRSGQISCAVNSAYHGYEEAFVLARNLSRSSPSELFSLPLKVLIFALYNNMGTLYHNNMCRFEDAAQCFQAAQKHLNKNDLLPKMLDQGDALTREEVRDFALNLMVSPLTTTPAA